MFQYLDKHVNSGYHSRGCCLTFCTAQAIFCWNFG